MFGEKTFLFGGKTYFERKRQLLAKQKIGNNFGQPTQK